jgi:hypothetical protein
MIVRRAVGQGCSHLFRNRVVLRPGCPDALRTPISQGPGTPKSPGSKVCAAVAAGRGRGGQAGGPTARLLTARKTRKT